MVKKIIKKIKKEYLYLILVIRYKPKMKKRLSLMGPEYLKFGKNVSIGNFWRIENYSKYENYKFLPKTIIGDNNFIGNFFTILNATTIIIGDNNLIASHVLITTINHGSNIEEGTFASQKISVKPITIGNNCWIGENVIILPGVSIGDNCIIGAGSVVTHDILSNTISVGNPAKMIKKWNFYNHNRERLDA